MIFKDLLLLLISLPVHHLSNDISTRPKQVSPVQMTGGQFSTWSYVHDLIIIRVQALNVQLYSSTLTVLIVDVIVTIIINI